MQALLWIEIGIVMMSLAFQVVIVAMALTCIESMSVMRLEWMVRALVYLIAIKLLHIGFTKMTVAPVEMTTHTK